MRTVTFTFLLFALLLHAALACAELPAPTRIEVAGVELHYVERGTGEPLILLHGGQGDLRAWGPHISVLSKHYRVISYSRRYHWPNRNPVRPGYSALVDAEDLAGLIRALDLGRVHLVGRSAGAFAALALAAEHPEMVRSMVLAEPPVLAWLANSPEGAPLYRDFMARTHEKAAPLFAAGDDVGALTTFIDAFNGPGTFAKLPEARRTSVVQNVAYFKAITMSADPYPDLPRDVVAKLDVPVLVVRGEHGYPRDVFVTDELVHTLPSARLFVKHGAGHGSPQDKPAEFTEAVMEFLQAMPSMRCTVATLRGQYVFAGQGLIEALEPGVQRMHYGHFVFDGRGKLTGRQSSSRGGRIGRETLEGTYTLEEDCSGSMAFRFAGKPDTVTQWDVYATSDGRKGHIIRMDEGKMAVRSFEK